MVTFLLIVVYISFAALGLPDSTLGNAWPIMGPELGADTAFAGIVQFTVSACTVFSSLKASYFLQRFGTGKVTLVSVCLTAVALLGYSLTGSFWPLIPFAVCLGLGAGAVDTALNNYVALHFEARHMSWLNCCWGLGAMTSTSVMAYFLGTGVWRMGFRTVSLLLFAIVTLLLFTQKLWRIYEKEPAKEEATEQLVTNAEVIQVKGVKPLMLAMLCYNGAEAVAMLWMATYFIGAKGLEADTAAVCCSAFYISITLGRLICGSLSAKISDKYLIRWGILVAICGIILILLPLPAVVTVIGLFVTGFGGASIYPSIVHSTPERFGERYSSTAIGLEIAAAYVGATCLPTLAGFISGQFGLVLIPLIMLGAFILMLVCTELANQ